MKKIRILVAIAAAIPAVATFAQPAAPAAAAAPVPAAPAPAAAPALIPAAPPAPLYKWEAAQPGRTPEAYFVNLQSGAKIETPYLVKFGLSGGYGLAPISKPIAGKSGHHHLLVNRELPLDFKQPLPFNEQYIHFGKGQMETVLTLAPGTYTLRLLLADEHHLPRFVYSKPMNITVTKKNADVDPASLVHKGISIPNLTSNAVVRKPFRVQFHASGFNVAHKAQQVADSGHFKLMVIPKKGAPVEMSFVEGQTEAWLTPPPGPYTLKLHLIDNLDATHDLAEPVSVPVTVRAE